MKKIIEDGQKRPLEEFAQCAVIYLAQHPECDEVVQQANEIIDLEHDTMTSPSLVYELPEGYEYNFSDVIGVSRKHKKGQLHLKSHFLLFEKVINALPPEPPITPWSNTV